MGLQSHNHEKTGQESEERGGRGVSVRIDYEDEDEDDDDGVPRIAVLSFYHVDP